MERIDDDDFITITMPDGSKREVLKDKGRYRVPLHMSDAAPLRLDLHDGNGGDVGSRPGWCAPTDLRLGDAKQRARDAYIAETSAAWQNPPTGAGSGEFASPSRTEGGACSIDGTPGVLCRVNGGLVCVIPERSTSGANTGDGLARNDARERAYEDNLQTQRDAWKGGNA